MFHIKKTRKEGDSQPCLQGWLEAPTFRQTKLRFILGHDPIRGDSPVPDLPVGQTNVSPTMTRGDETVKILQDVTRISGTSPLLLLTVVVVFILVTREHLVINLSKRCDCLLVFFLANRHIRGQLVDVICPG